MESLHFNADVLRIVFVRDSFNRQRKSECDPPYEIVKRAIDSFLKRLRFVTSAFQIREKEFPYGDEWHLEYLKDDESPFDPDPALLRGRGTKKFSMEWIGLDR